jgi:hypothetical protein
MVASAQGWGNRPEGVVPLGGVMGAPVGGHLHGCEALSVAERCRALLGEAVQRACARAHQPVDGLHVT